MINNVSERLPGQHSHRGGKAYLFPHRRPTPQPFTRILLRLGLVDLDHAAVQLGLVHVVDGFTGVFGERELDVAEAAVRVVVGGSDGMLAKPSSEVAGRGGV